MKTSEVLEIGQVYTRSWLIERFNIGDATINTGVFCPKDQNSIWLFVTKHKTSDRTQYFDFLDGQTLSWDGQLSGRTDDLIINHNKFGREIVLFYRSEKYEYPHAGFRFEGVFEYLSHAGAKPAHFKLNRMK